MALDAITRNERMSKRRIDKLLKRLDVKDMMVHGTYKEVHSDEKRVECVNAYLLYGNMVKVAEITGVPLKTLRDWKQYKPWWKDLENVLKEEHDMSVAGELTDVVARTVEAIKDRVQKGDFVYNPRTGEISRVPVKAADLNKIMGTMVDKKLTLQKQPVKYTSTTTDNKAQLENKLEQLAKSFASFTSSRSGDVIKRDREAIGEAIEGELIQSPT